MLVFQDQNQWDNHKDISNNAQSNQFICFYKDERCIYYVLRNISAIVSHRPSGGGEMPTFSCSPTSITIRYASRSCIHSVSPIVGRRDAQLELQLYKYLHPSHIHSVSPIGGRRDDHLQLQLYKYGYPSRIHSVSPIEGWRDAHLQLQPNRYSHPSDIHYVSPIGGRRDAHLQLQPDKYGYPSDIHYVSPIGGQRDGHLQLQPRKSGYSSCIHFVSISAMHPVVHTRQLFYKCPHRKFSNHKMIRSKCASAHVDGPIPILASGRILPHCTRK